ncbi:MAG TPA: hypothetical protein VIM17_09870 [Jatrophihabitantaceae bacterium]
MIIGLLLIALVCLALGVALQSSVWLVASLIATAGAGFLLYKLRDVTAAPKRAAPAKDSGLDDATSVTGRTVATPIESDSASPDAAADTAPAGDGSAADEFAADEFAADSAGADADAVWVIDGRPRYHLGNCAIIKGQDAEAIPFEQATQDGFMPCTLCEPHAGRTR